ncbi:MAG: hypothetical protein KDE28_19695 [Anaerolineales bacterium]|nr:hypothetical protein [Anaerolineales bacterium]
MRKTLFHLLAPLFTLLLLTSLACAVGGDDDFQVTVAALGDLVVATATARADDEVDPADLLATAEASATEVVQTLESEAATRAAIPTPTPIPPPPTPVPLPTDSGEIEDPAVTAIKAELVSLGIPDSGRLGWLHEPVTVAAEGAGQFAGVNDFGGPVTENFVIASDIVWEAASGSSGCGFMLRTSSAAADSSQYLLLATRQGNGQIQMLPRLVGAIVPEQAVVLEVNPPDAGFSLEDGGRNRLLVVANGPSLFVFSNGVPLGEITPATPLGPGGVAFIALSDGGPTSCQFENSWLWLQDPE